MPILYSQICLIFIVFLGFWKEVPLKKAIGSWNLTLESPPFPLLPTSWLLLWCSSDANLLCKTGLKKTDMLVGLFTTLLYSWGAFGLTTWFVISHQSFFCLLHIPRWTGVASSSSADITRSKHLLDLNSTKNTKVYGKLKKRITRAIIMHAGNNNEILVTSQRFLSNV